MEVVKPLLKYFITIDFGHVTYEQDFLELLQNNDMEILKHVPIVSSAHHVSSAFLTVVQKKTK